MKVCNQCASEVKKVDRNGMCLTCKKQNENYKMEENKILLTLSHCKNPDIVGIGYWEIMNRPNKTIVEVKSFKEASKICKEYIEKYSLGGGNWNGGQLKVKGKIIAHVSYNGRVWEGKAWTVNCKEIKIRRY